MKRRYTIVILNIGIFLLYSFYIQKKVNKATFDAFITLLMCIGYQLVFCAIIGIICQFIGKKEEKIGFLLSFLLILLIGLGICYPFK
jgi:hypothetical protein